MARSMIAARKALAGPLPAELVPDPGLDILLALFVGYASGRETGAAMLVDRIEIAPSIVDRWIAVMVQYGFVRVEGETAALTAKGVDAVTETLKAVAESQWHLEETA